MTHQVYIACVYVPKLFLILAINSNNCLYYNIIIYKLNPLIDVVILEISI